MRAEMTRPAPVPTHAASSGVTLARKTLKALRAPARINLRTCPVKSALSRGRRAASPPGTPPAARRFLIRRRWRDTGFHGGAMPEFAGHSIS